ncbi:cytochrome c oxidase subunit 2A [Bacillaceae bacterium W0354]
MANEKLKKNEKHDEGSQKGALVSSLVFVALSTALLWFGLWGLYMVRV